MECKLCNQNNIDSTSGICDECCFVEQKQEEESFEEFCIRTGHKPFGTQGIDGSKYDYDSFGNVVQRIKFQEPN